MTKVKHFDDIRDLRDGQRARVAAMMDEYDEKERELNKKPKEENNESAGEETVVDNLQEESA